MFDQLEVQTGDGWRQRGIAMAITPTAVTGNSGHPVPGPHHLATTNNGCDVAVPARASPEYFSLIMTYLSLSHSLTAVSILATKE